MTDAEIEKSATDYMEHRWSRNDDVETWHTVIRSEIERAYSMDAKWARQESAQAVLLKRDEATGFEMTHLFDLLARKI